MSEHKHLHPITILFNAVRIVRETIIPIGAGFLSFRGESFIYFLLGLIAFLIILLAFSVASWYRFTYRIVEDELRIEYGIFIRKKRYISKNRIQSIDLTAGVVHRLFNLVKVKIETAGSGTGAEASLKAVKMQEGENVRTELQSLREQAGAPDADIDSTSVQTDFSEQITAKRLFFAGSTSGSAGVMLAILGFGFLKIEQFIPEHIFDSTLEWIIGLSVVFIFVLVCIIFVLFWLIGIAGTMIKYGKFTITKRKDELFITRGLLEKKQITIPLNRVQAIGIQESIIRQPLGFVTVFAEVAGGSSLDKGEDFSTVLFPIMKASEVAEFLENYLPDYITQSQVFHPLPKRAMAYYLFRSTFPVLFIAAGISWFFPQFIWGAILLIIGSLGLGFLRYKDTGHHVDGQRLTVRYRGFSRMTMRFYQKRVQAFEKRQHKLQKLQRLATMKLSIIGIAGTGRHYRIKHMEEGQVDQLADWYSYRE